MIAGAFNQSNSTRLSAGIGVPVRWCKRMAVMRNRACVSGILILAAIASPLACLAQKFQEPTKEELQMTSDPKAPGAAAVFLYREESTDNHNHFVSEYAASRCSRSSARSGRRLRSLRPWLLGYADDRGAHDSLRRHGYSADREGGRSAYCKDNQESCQGGCLQPPERRSGKHSGIQVDHGHERRPRIRHSR